MNVSAAAFNMPDDDHGMWSRNRALLHNDQPWHHDMRRAVGHFVANFQSAVRALPSKASNDLVRNLPNQNHLPSSRHDNVSPLQRPQLGAEPTSMEYDPSRRNLAADAIPTLADVKTSLHAAMLRTIQPGRVPAKEVAHKIAASQHTVESMRQNGPPDAMARLVMACLAYPEFRAEVGRLMGMHSEINPDAQKLMSELVMLMQRGR